MLKIAVWTKYQNYDSQISQTKVIQITTDLSKQQLNSHS